MWRAVRSLGRSPVGNSVPRLLPLRSDKGGRRQGNVIGSPGWLGRLASYVAATVGDGIDQSFLPQHSHGTPRRGPRDLELVNQLTLGGYPRVRPVLARVDPPTNDRRDLPVWRNRGDRVNTVSAPICHIRNFSCTGLTSHTVIRTASTSHVYRQVDTGRGSLSGVGRVVRSLFARNRSQRPCRPLIVSRAHPWVLQLTRREDSR